MSKHYPLRKAESIKKREKKKMLFARSLLLESVVTRSNRKLNCTMLFLFQKIYNKINCWLVKITDIILYAIVRIFFNMNSTVFFLKRTINVLFPLKQEQNRPTMATFDPYIPGKSFSFVGLNYLIYFIWIRSSKLFDDIEIRVNIDINLNSKQTRLGWKWASRI